MNIPFTKMHGLGNDFVLIEEDQLPPESDLGQLASLLCNRHFGIGADGLIIVSPADDPSCDIQFKFYNNDGSRAEMCGNGIRCFARYIKDQGIIKQSEFKVETLAGPAIPRINADHSVTVDMGPPHLVASEIPFSGTTDKQVLSFPLQISLNGNQQTFPVNAVGMGNPHAIIFRRDVPEMALDYKLWGPPIETHPLFPAKTNVEFVDILDKHTVDVLVWERGVGPTLACGSGACAVAVAGILRGFVESPVTIQLPGGNLTIQWDGPGHNVKMTGAASYVFAGSFPLSTSGLLAHF